MTLGELRKVLRTAEAHYRSDGRGEMADALSSLATDLIKGDDSQSVASFVSRVEKARKPTAPRTVNKGKRKR